MKSFVIYSASGEVLRSGVCQDDELAFQAGAGEFMLEGSADPELDVVDVAAGAVAVGGKPPPTPPPYDYRQARARAYPAVAEQLDMLWHAMGADPAIRLEPFYSRIAAVKAAYPKDGGDPGEAIIYGADAP